MKQSIRNLHYALLTKDDKTCVKYEDPTPLVGAVSARITPASESATQYADDGIYDMAYALGEIAVEIAVADLPLKAQAELLGHKYKNGVMVKSDSDQPPHVALGFMSQLGSAAIEFHWLYKGKFALLESEYNTATNTPAWREPTLRATFMRRIHDGQWHIVANSGDDGFDPELAKDWFTEVQEAPEEAPDNGDDDEGGDE